MIGCFDRDLKRLGRRERREKRNSNVFDLIQRYYRAVNGGGSFISFIKSRVHTILVLRKAYRGKATRSVKLMTLVIIMGERPVNVDAANSQVPL